MHLLAINQVVLGITVVGFVVASTLMVLIVLVQRPQGGGLSDAFGAGAGGGGTAFGAKTGDALTTGTIGVFILFLTLAITLNFWVRPGAVNDQTTIGAPGTTTAPVQQAAPTAVNEQGNQIGLKRIDDPTQIPAIIDGSTPAPGSTPIENTGAVSGTGEGSP